jgi:hypothetical protein
MTTSLPEPTTRVSRPILMARRYAPLTVPFAAVAVAGLVLAALALVLEPGARIGVALVAAACLVGAVWFGDRARRAAS